jgi:regulator of RNase E activity RraA
MEKVYPMTPGKRLAARARTLRYLPPRPDLMARLEVGENAPEYRAMARCGPGDVLVADMFGTPRACIFGDVKALQLKMNQAEGIVTDGAIRDLGVMIEENYNLIIYAQDRTPYASGPWTVPAEENGDIQCGGALVRPGDVLVGDNDGVVVVPSWFAAECVAMVEEHEAVEAYVKRKIEAEGVRPGKYYPPSPELYEEYRRSQGR